MTARLALVSLLAGSMLQAAQTPPDNPYADPGACASCHPKIAATYARTGMARSFYRPQAVAPVRYYHEPSETWYSMEQRDGQTWQRRWRIGPDGKETDVSETRADYVMGSGNHARTFLSRTGRGALVELPLAWYSENGGYWAMNPGHDRPYALPPRTVAYECMFCHNAYPRIPAGHSEPGSEPVFAGALPEGIDCQRCHGPGASHVRTARTAGARSADIRRAIVNPARLSQDRQMEVCYQCHLETTSLSLPHSIRKYGSEPFSYNPGEPLDKFLLFFDHAKGSKYENDFEIAHSAYRLRQSKCFLESKSAMTCTTCHDPHDIPRGEAATLHYNGVCRECHTSAFHLQVAAGKHTAAENCVECHMPKRRTLDVVNAVMTDHYIQRRPPPGDPLAPLAERHETTSEQYRGPVVPYYYYPSPLPPTPENILYAAVAQAQAPRLAAEIQKQKPARPEFYVELGQAWLTANNPGNAVAAFEEAVRREPESPVAQLNLAEGLTRAGQPAKALDVLNRAVKSNPDDALLWYQLGLSHSNADRLNEATAALEKAVALDPLLADAWTLLGISRASGGDMVQAEAAFRSALRAEPDHPDALGNLAHLLSATGDLPQADYYFARAVRMKPDDSEIRVNYAVTLAGLNRLDEARREAEAAVKADPKSPDAHNFLGTLLARANQPDTALREFLAAADLRPGFGLAHLNAAALLAAKGDAVAARAHLQFAARDSDPRIRQRALQQLR
ncbi:MAG: tetratricopeptide repeat protein [Acidobacteriota bacterium]